VSGCRADVGNFRIPSTARGRRVLRTTSALENSRRDRIQHGPRPSAICFSRLSRPYAGSSQLQQDSRHRSKYSTSSCSPRIAFPGAGHQHNRLVISEMLTHDHRRTRSACSEDAWFFRLFSLTPGGLALQEAPRLIIDLLLAKTVDAQGNSIGRVAVLESLHSPMGLLAGQASRPQQGNHAKS